MPASAMLIQQLDTNNNDNLTDLLFFVRYMPKVLISSLKYGLGGALLGYGLSYACTEGLSAFARDHHDAVDINGNYVRDEDEFLRASRNQQFNEVTPPVSSILPLYSAAIGAGAGFFFGFTRACSKYAEGLEADREYRLATKALV